MSIRRSSTHDILPGRIGELLPGMGLKREKDFHRVGMQYVERVRLQLEDTLVTAAGKPMAEIKSEADLPNEETKACYVLFKKMESKAAENGVYTSPLSPAQVGKEVNALLEHHHDLHLTPAIPYGNMWASCYFAMTGFHALHVLGGIVIFVIILLIGLMGKLGAAPPGAAGVYRPVLALC